MAIRLLFGIGFLVFLINLSGCKKDDPILVPSITSFAPTEGGPGTVVTIRGNNFSTDPTKNNVAIENVSISVDNASTTQLQITIPANAISGKVNVTVGSQTTSSSAAFTVLGLPSLLTLTPASGKAGDVIKVSGKYFSNVAGLNTLTYSGRTVPVTIMSSTELNFTVPASGKTGSVIVTTPLGTSNALPFRQQMVIESFSPSSGPLGTKVKIKGSGLSSSYLSFFAGTPGVAISDTGTELIIAPAKGTSSGLITIKESSNGESVTTVSNFTLTDAPLKLLASYPGIAKQGAAGFTIGTDIYVGSGQDNLISNFNDFWKYSTTSNTWTQVANFPGVGGSSFGSSFSVGGKGYVVCGINPGSPTKSVWQYDPSNNTWTALPGFPGAARARTTCFVIGNFAYVGFGDSSGVLNKDFYQFDPSNGSWIRKSDFNEGLYGAAGFAISGTGYITGGANSSSSGGATFAAIWSYNPATDSWKKQISTVPFQAGNNICHGFTINGIGYIQNGTQMWQYIISTDAALGKDGSWVEIQTATDGSLGSKGVFLPVGAKGYIWAGNDKFYELTPPE